MLCFSAIAIRFLIHFLLLLLLPLLPLPLLALRLLWLPSCLSHTEAAAAAAAGWGWAGARAEPGRCRRQSSICSPFYEISCNQLFFLALSASISLFFLLYFPLSCLLFFLLLSLSSSLLASLPLLVLCLFTYCCPRLQLFLRLYEWMLSTGRNRGAEGRAGVALRHTGYLLFRSFSAEIDLFCLALLLFRFVFGKRSRKFASAFEDLPSQVDRRFRFRFHCCLTVNCVHAPNAY